MHPVRPLNPDEPAFDDWQEPEGGDQNQWRHNRELKAQRRVEELLGEEGPRDQHVADDEDRHIGRRVIGAVARENEAAFRAGVARADIAGKERMGAAFRAALAHPAQHGVQPRTIIALAAKSLEIRADFKFAHDYTCLLATRFT